MACRRHLAIVLSACLLANALCVPTDFSRRRRGFDDNELDGSKESAAPLTLSSSKSEASTSASTSAVGFDSFEDDDDDDDVFSEPMQTSPTGGSSIFSLLRLAGALFPGSSSANPLLGIAIKELLAFNQHQGIHGSYGIFQGQGIPQGPFLLRRQDVGDNEIDIDYVQDLKQPPFQRQEEESNESDSSESDEGDDDDQNNAAEESFENGDDNDGGERASDQEDDASNGDDDDYDEPPEGDGQGGGILGILAGLSGGEDGQSDLGSLLATISGIVVSLSGDGVDVNALIGTALGLFVGLLSEGAENPGAILASYLLTSLETLTGGGAKNNGAFFGNFISKLVKGTSAGGDPDEDAGSEEEGGGMKMTDSAGFFGGLVMGLLGDMSKTSSGGSSAWRRYEQLIANERDRATEPQQQQPASPIWTFKMDILRAILQFGTSVIGMASASSTNAMTQ